MPDIIFAKPVPVLGFGTPTKVRLTQSDTFAGVYSQVGVEQPLLDGAELSSGLNFSGFRYRITAQSAVDFTTIGAINNDIGTEFMATGQVVLSATDKLLPLGLEENPADPDEYIISEPALDVSKFTRIYLVTAGGVAGDSVVLEPKVATPDSFQIFAYGSDAGLEDIAGIELDISPVGGAATAGDMTIVQSIRTVTGVDGRASVDNVPADAGNFYVNFGGERKMIDTTGRGATSVNWKDIS